MNVLLTDIKLFKDRQKSFEGKTFYQMVASIRVDAADKSTRMESIAINTVEGWAKDLDVTIEEAKKFIS